MLNGLLTSTSRQNDTKYPTLSEQICWMVYQLPLRFIRHQIPHRLWTNMLTGLWASTYLHEGPNPPPPLNFRWLPARSNVGFAANMFYNVLYVINIYIDRERWLVDGSINLLIHDCECSRFSNLEEINVTSTIVKGGPPLFFFFGGGSALQ